MPWMMIGACNWRFVPLSAASLSRAMSDSFLRPPETTDWLCGRVHLMSCIRFDAHSEMVLPVLLAAAKDRQVEARRAAVESLRSFPSDPRACKVLAEALHDPDAANRYRERSVAHGAACSLWQFGRDAKPAIPDLIWAVRARPSEDIREMAIRALAGVAKRDEASLAQVVAFFLDMLRKGDDIETRRAALGGLASIGPAATEAVPDILALVRAGKGDASKDARGLRSGAVRVLPAIAPQDARVIEFLVGVLRDRENDSNDRINAAEALGKAGPLAQQAVPALTEALEDKDTEIRIVAATVLKRLGPLISHFASVASLPDTRDGPGAGCADSVEAVGTVSRPIMHHDGLLQWRLILMSCLLQALTFLAVCFSDSPGDGPGLPIQPFRLTGHHGPILSLTFSPDGKYLATAGKDGAVRFWEVANRKLLWTRFNQWKFCLRGCVFTRTEGCWQRLAPSGVIRLWTLQVRPLGISRGMSGRQRQLPSVRTANRLASGGYDGTVRLWDLATFRPGAGNSLRS